MAPQRHPGESWPAGRSTLPLSREGSPATQPLYHLQMEEYNTAAVGWKNLVCPKLLPFRTSIKYITLLLLLLTSSLLIHVIGSMFTKPTGTLNAQI